MIYHVIAILPPTELLRNKYKIPQGTFTSFSEDIIAGDPYDLLSKAHIITQILHRDEKCVVET